MAAITFPTSPTVGQSFTSGDRSWTWNGTTWGSNAAVITGPTGATGVAGATGADGATGPAGPTANIDNFTLETIMSIY